MATEEPGAGSLFRRLRYVGPGLVVAATGVGAGDLIAAASAGARLGLVVLWAAAAGALLKLALADGVARWQLVTGTTLLEGWVRELGWFSRTYLTVYLVLWTFVVSAALMSACGLAAHALAPWLSVRTWAVLHAIAGAILVALERYSTFERVMKWAVGLMFVTIVGSAAISLPPAGELVAALVIPRVPEGGTLMTAGVMGGVGGTLTLLSYGYWLREKGWSGTTWLAAARLDLALAYVLTGLFGCCLIILGATVLHPAGLAIEGSSAALQLAGMLGERFGRAGELVFLLGFWAAVATSLVGVWQGVPYLFAHLQALLRRFEGERLERALSTRSAGYRGYLLFMTFPPMLLLLLDRPVWLVVVYAALGSLFMPFLAVTLLILNRRGGRLGTRGNGPLAVAALLLCVVLFVYLALHELGIV